MTTPSADSSPAAAPRVPGWWSLFGGGILLLLLPAVPPFSVIFPLADTGLVLVPALAACALAGWKAGGRLSLALVWGAFAVWVVAMGAPAGSYALLARGWGVLVAVAFGGLAIFWPDRAFLTRALGTLGLALLVSGVVAVAVPGGASRVRQVVAGELVRRAQQFDAEWQARIATKEWQDFRAANAESATWFERTLEEQRAVIRRTAERSSTYFPALLALETLAALALAWALYQRIGRVTIGAPLARLRDFRFNDQLVWGLISGLVLVLMPGLGPVRDVGANLLMFFGALYVLRGAGVAAYFLAPGRILSVVFVVTAVVFAGATGVIFLGLGLGDTWIDWRRRTRPST